MTPRFVSGSRLIGYLLELPTLCTSSSRGWGLDIKASNWPVHNICSPSVFLCLKHNFVVWNSNLLHMICWLIPKKAIFICWNISILSVVVFLFVFQLGSVYLIYQQSNSIKVYKYREDNAYEFELSQNFPFSKKYFVGITVNFCPAP